MLIMSDGPNPTVAGRLAITGERLSCREVMIGLSLSCETSTNLISFLSRTHADIEDPPQRDSEMESSKRTE